MNLDYFRTPLAIGDEVAFYRPGYREFVTGTILRFTPKKIVVEYWHHSEDYMLTYTEHSSNFIKRP